VDEEGRLHAITLDPRIEERVASSLQATTTGTIPVLPPAYLRALVDGCSKMARRMSAQGSTAVFLVSPRIRPYLRKILAKIIPDMVMLSYGELAGEVELKTFGTVENPEEQS
jgi:flagellar biosynthesis protein FlhA